MTDVFCGILLCWGKCGYISRFLLIYAMIYVKIQNETCKRPNDEAVTSETGGKMKAALAAGKEDINV